MNYSLDFVGGTSTNVTFDKEYTLEEIDSQMIPSLEEITGDKNIQVQTVKDSNQVVFKTQTLDLEKREALASYLNENYGVEASDIATENISSTVSSEMRRDAVISCDHCYNLYAALHLVPFQRYPFRKQCSTCPAA